MVRGHFLIFCSDSYVVSLYHIWWLWLTTLRKLWGVEFMDALKNQHIPRQVTMGEDSPALSTEQASGPNFSIKDAYLDTGDLRLLYAVKHKKETDATACIQSAFHAMVRALSLHNKSTVRIQSAFRRMNYKEQASHHQVCLNLSLLSSVLMHLTYIFLFYLCTENVEAT